MLKRLSGVILTLLAGSTLSAQPVAIPNASFEEGTDSPTGWKLADGKGQWVKGEPGRQERFVTATGNGSDTSHWRTGELAMKPGTIYRLRFCARNIDGRDGTAITGPTFSSADLGIPPNRWKQYEYHFVTPEDLKADLSWLRFGQWNVNGSVAFDKIELHEAQAVHFTQGDMVLGAGERILGRDYAFHAPMDDERCRNYARPLVRQRCTFHSNRWWFHAASEVVYRHRIGSRKQTGATVEVGVGWYDKGELVVQAGTDGKTWKELGSVDKIAGKTLEIPKDMLPAEEVWIRLSGRGKAASGKDADASLQVTSFAYQAVLDGEPTNAVGATYFFAATQTDPRLKVTIRSIGTGPAGGDANAILEVRNLTDGKLALLGGAATSLGASAQTPETADQGPGRRQVECPPGTTVVALPYELPGSGDGIVRLDLREPGPGGNPGAPVFAAEASLHVPSLFEAYYGQKLPGSDEKVGLWWTESGRKISQARPVPKKAGQEMLIRAARNEAEAAQLVVRPAAGLKGFTAKPGALSGPNGAVIPAECIDILRVRYVMVTHPTDSTSVVAPWPDPLPPLKEPMDVPAGRNQPLWIRVKVPKDSPAGAYTGKIKLTAEGYSAEAPLRVEVYDFTLPDRMTCTTAFGFSPGNVWRYQNLTDPNHRRLVLEKYWANFSAHHISPYDPAPLDGFKVTWPGKAATRTGGPEAIKPTIDWTAWDRAMKRAFEEYHFNSFSIPIVGMGGGTFQFRVEPSLLGYAENTPEYQAAFTSYCRQVQEHLRQNGWLNDAYVYWFDEPDKKDYEFVMKGFNRLKNAAPDITRMLTEQVEPELVGGPNLWCPVTPDYNHEAAEKRRQFGERFWWYVCCVPKGPYCTLFIDHPGTDLRVWLWQTWARKIDGILVWETNYWTSSSAYPDPNRPQNPYEDPMGWVSGYGVGKGQRQPWGNGDGRFIYPPEAAADAHPTQPVLEGPVDSIRWEMLRDGIEDYEYLAILRGLVQKHKARLLEDRRKQYAEMLEVPKTVTADMTTFTTDPAVIENRRHQAAKAIEELGKLSSGGS